MKPEYPNLLHYKNLIICIVILCLSACTQLPVKQPVEKDKAPIPEEVPEPAKEETEDDQPKISIIEILSTEAEKFSLQGNYQDALFVYNQALSQASEDEKPPLVLRIESVLMKTPTKDIEGFIDIKNIHIPRPLLLYWLGLNYALENNAVKSKEILETFLFQYPDHPYYSDAADLVDVIKKSLFKRNTIGCLLPLTGKYAVFGQRALSGIQLAIQELSKKYSREFKLIIKDTQANSNIAIEGIRQLHQKNVAGIIGPLLAVNQAGREAEKLQIPLIALTQKSDFPLQGDYLFANFITPEMQVQTLGAYLFLKLGIKKVAILYPNEKYGKKYMGLFWDIVDEYDGEVVGVEPYDGKKTDFAEPIQKLTGQFFPLPDFLKPEAIEPENNAALYEDQNIDLLQIAIESEIRKENEEEKIQIDFEALFIPDSPSRVNLILPQLAFNDARGMYLIGTNLWHHKSLLKEAKGYNKHAIITDGFFDGSQNSATVQFTKKFESLFKTKPKFLEAISYDTASMLFLTAMDETIDSRQTLKDALQGKRIFEGVTGNTIFDKDGTAHRELFLMTIKRGEFVEISR
ncbi:penicillin-binding protein activator [Desulfobacula sp.]|uniref:penicillin-binding protein activator n=1 Tax=Desulfobacula sp. TaxID=2593537 RepID=UPI002608B12F|nr:penicillin-binding protein activator [Desulfobacula sp.]